MFNKKEYHREYIKIWRKNRRKSLKFLLEERKKARDYYHNVIAKNPKAIQKKKEYSKSYQKRKSMDLEWVKNNRRRIKEYRLRLGVREKETKQRKEYYSTKEGNQTIRKANRKYELSNPIRRKAWFATKYQMKIGKIKKLPCRDCGSKNVHAHHPDISKPLEVIFLCPLHHRQEELKRISQIS